MPDSMPADRALCSRIKICNKRGLHARASARFVRTAECYDAQIEVTKDDTTVGGTSIMGLMMLAAGPGSTVLVKSKGPQARQALDAIIELVSNGFDEDNEAAGD